jgi:hypothetical protein
VIRVFTERAKVLCDSDQLADELKNIEDVFVANEYPRETVQEYMGEGTVDDRNAEPDLDIRGRVTIPYVPGVSEKFPRIAKRHRFLTSMTPGGKLKNIKSQCQTPVGDKRRAAVYTVPCKCIQATYTGETWRKWETRKGEHKSKVRLTLQDVAEGRNESAEKRMGTEDGGLARHATGCEAGVDWDNSKILTIERGYVERKVREAIESVRIRHTGQAILNNSRNIEDWKPVLYSYFDKGTM